MSKCFFFLIKYLKITELINKTNIDNYSKYHAQIAFRAHANHKSIQTSRHIKTIQRVTKQQNRKGKKQSINIY